MKNPKIVVIGSGSQFTEFFLQEYFKYEEFKGSTLAFVDRKKGRLAQEIRLAKFLKDTVGWDVKIEGSPERRDVLPGATFIYCFVAINHMVTWKKEFELANKHGIYPLEAYTVGGPGLGMSMRHIPVMMDICKDIEELCPNAWLLLDNNPLAKIVAAIHRHTKVKCIGYCNGHELVQMALEQLLNLDERDPSERDADPVEREFMVPAGNVDITLAGINHLQWLLEINDSKTGEDLYPKVRKYVNDNKRIPSGYRFSAEVCKLFGYFPSPADNHVADYIWCIDRSIFKDFNLTPYPVDQWFGGRDEKAWAEIANSINDDESAREFIKKRRVGWLNLQLARYIMTGGEKYFPALNLPNGGAISNLDPDIIVEVPAIVGPNGTKALTVGELPYNVEPICSLHGKISNIVADACVIGSRQLALEALLLDPFVHNLKTAKAYLADILEYNKDYYTRF
jgi:alpha-galactosidase